MAEDDKDDLETGTDAEEELEEELLEEPAEPEEDELKCEECAPCKAGAPAWMATFADMATLLMAFFVLILSFAEMNVPKYKQITLAKQTMSKITKQIVRAKRQFQKIRKLP